LQAKDRSWSTMAILSWLQLICDALIFKAQDQADASKVMSDIQSAQIQKLSPVSSERLLKLSDFLIQAERDIASNLDPVLVFEKMWVSYARVG
jgi:hypothetical protein